MYQPSHSCCQMRPGIVGRLSLLTRLMISSMKNDFKTFYGDGVVKTDFIFPTDTRTLTE